MDTKVLKQPQAPDTENVLGQRQPVSWWKDTHLIKLNIGIVCLTFLSSTNGYDSSLLNGLQALPSWLAFLNEPNSTWMGFINALYWIGAAVSTLFAPLVANRYGRKKGIWVGYFFIVVGTALQTASPNATSFIVARLFTGASMGWMNNTAPLLITEVAHPDHRSIATALYMTWYYIGSITAAWITFGTHSWDSSWAWRLPSLCQLLMPAIALPGMFLVPESPRWLVSKNKISKAHKTLADHHAGGNQDDLLVLEQLGHIQAAITAEIEAEKDASYAEMLRTPGNRHRLFISITLGFFDQWVGNGPLSYYLTLVLKLVGITQTSNQLIISACLQIWNIFFALGAALCVDRVGRHRLFVTSAATMLGTYVIITGLTGSFVTTNHAPTGIAVVPFIFIYFAGYDIALTPLLTSYPVEIWPYRLRSRGLMVTWISCIVAVIFNTFVNPIAIDGIGWKYYIVYIALLVTWLVITFFWYPETRGLSLEDIVVRFDGESTILNGSGEDMDKNTYVEEEKKE